MVTGDTKMRILAAARIMARERGYYRLNIRELAKSAGIRSATIHYHFSTKSELAGVLAAEYTAGFSEYIYSLLAERLDPRICMLRYLDLFRESLQEANRMCLLRLLGVERTRLPDGVAPEIGKFIIVNENWIAWVSRQIDRDLDPVKSQRQASAIFAAVDVARQVAHRRNDRLAFDRIVESYRDMGIIP